jgi:hypothetical protein
MSCMPTSALVHALCTVHVHCMINLDDRSASKDWYPSSFLLSAYRTTTNFPNTPFSNW